ncbi:hypothetical protein [Desulfonema ishimotonii]|uniref:hypothetical protein n=1 Tax=Desulfonema ishimotonii TaxID=45657 RepID=UPI000F55E792|nr:hypothetical protein [Desulfonema ishimotonii]
MNAELAKHAIRTAYGQLERIWGAPLYQVRRLSGLDRGTFDKTLKALLATCEVQVMEGDLRVMRKEDIDDSYVTDGFVCPYIKWWGGNGGN